MTHDPLSAVMEATWPPARRWREGAFDFRDGAGGGKRVSAASCEGDWDAADLDRLGAMAEPLVMIRPSDAALDAALAARGWRIVDPVVVCSAPIAALAADLPPLAAFPHWPPLAIAASLWAEGGIGAARLAVMERVRGAKVAILARHEDRPAGVAFAALHGTEAMLHALEVRPDRRGRGVGGTLVHAAANWAAALGAERLSLVVTERNTAARALYARLGMEVVGQYHYRMK
ncbi:GNAT family N-acetyltransferase [Tabrizicola caldifontis]|uniref:GNAT family N-acetyltransferase n=1 Tax=Tabrizicola caldifontis TaxID=2528036 RepID=UPI001081CB09|nr:GNAT family N-acetyltransferase [Rhodobacter sp. YIM 73028]